MKQKQTTTRSRLWRAAALSITGALVAGTFAAAPSFADVPPTNPPYASIANASDPYLYACSPGVVIDPKWCIVTSKDLGTGTRGTYPMNQTMKGTSVDGLAWSAPTVALNESSLYPIPGGITTPPKHLWAPAVRYWNKNGAEAHTLYVPDLTRNLANGTPDKYSSKVFVAESVGGGAFNVQGQVTGGTGAATLGYMSDPEVFADTATPFTDLSQDYLLWANGDNGDCGGLSIRKMTGTKTLLPYSTAAQVELKVTGWPSQFANCNTGAGDDLTYAHPYMEGASLFKFSRFHYAAANAVPGPYTLVFAAKPSAVPTECAGTAWGDSKNEVIAYATSSTVTGPYTYQGIIMCGSWNYPELGGGEWTNQASIIEVRTSYNDWRLLMVYHDGPSAGANNRKLHAECLFTNGGKFVNTMRSAEGAVSAAGTRNWCLQGETIIALKAPNGKYVTSKNGNLVATANVIGPWEQFAFSRNANGDFFNARHENKWVQSNQNKFSALEARGSSQGAWESFTFHTNGKIQSNFDGFYVRVEAATGKLIADSSAAGATVFDYQHLSD